METVSGFQTAEQTLDWHVQNPSDSFDVNYREDCVEAILAYHMQFSRGLIEIPEEFKPKHSGVQQAIDHISRKRDFIIANQPDNKLGAFCLTLISELQQFL